MKNTLPLLLALVLLVTGCSHRPHRFTVGVSQCSVDNWRDKFNEELRTAALLTDSLTVRIESANDDARQQERQIEAMIDEGVDLLVVSPTQVGAIVRALDRASASGIPVILYDRRSGSDRYTAFIGCDNRLIGYAMGLHIARRLGGHGRVAEIRGLEGSSPATLRHQGLCEALARYPGIRLVASESGNWKQESGEDAMRRILARGCQTDYVFAHNDRMALGARRTAEAQGRAGDILFAGVDGMAGEGGGLQLVRDSLLDASYLYPTKGDEVAALAMDILTRRPYRKENLLQASIVTKENAELSLMEAHDAERQRQYLGRLHGQVDRYLSQYRAGRVISIALGVILLLSLALIGVVYRALIVKARLNHRLDESNDELRRLNARIIDEAHSRLVFFTNVSHDLRTPLTLILDPAAQLQADTALRGRSRELIDIICRNAQSLQRLVDTILDLRKIQNGKMGLTAAPLDPAPHLRRWVADFEPTAHRKRVSLCVDTDGFTQTGFVTDREKLARIVFNLVSNALKYTPAGGRVSVTLSDRPGAPGLRLSVRDTGKGIARADLPRVFDRFFQAGGSQAGTGVGLAVVQSYTRLLGGTARAESTEGEGAEFIIELPPAPPATPTPQPQTEAFREKVDEAQPPLPGGNPALSSPVPASAEYVSGKQGTASELSKSASEKPEAASGLPEPAYENPGPVSCLSEPASATPPTAPAADHPDATVLVIDDNDDIRRYLHTLLSPHYRLLEAADGRRGLDTARAEVPDLILCDVMMPGISGLDVCRTLKQTPATSHIPVVMLTAKALDSQRTEGYECGADSYITKPFTSALLLARIGNLLSGRALLHRHYASAHPADDAPAAATDPRERTFMQQLHTVIERNLGNPDFSVEQLGAEVGLSRVQLYRKVKALTGTTAVDLLRRARLSRARRMLQTTHRSISEVAYETGFSSASYFSKCFKDEYGQTPAEFVRPQG